MAFTISYIDPGYGAGIDGVTCVENETYNPINGVAFTSDGGVYEVPFFSNASLKVNAFESKISVKFSAYLDLASDDHFVIGFSDRSGVLNENKSYIAFYSTGCGHSISGNGNTLEIPSPPTNGFHNVTFSVNAYAMTVNGTVYSVLTRDIDGNIKTWNKTFTDSSFVYSHILGSCVIFKFPNSSASTCYVSNIIIAKEEVNNPSVFGKPLLTSDYFPVKLPLKDTSGDFISLGDGEYLGNSAGQKLLSVVDASDASDVITKFGATSKVSHLVSYGHPGYRDSSNITSATGITEENGSIAAHGSCSLSTDTVASSYVAWAVDNTILSDVDGMKIGWQV